MGRERDLFAEDRIRAEGRERWRRQELANNTCPVQIEERWSDEATEEELPKYRLRTASEESMERQRRNHEILEARREAELAASDEREIPLDPEIEYHAKLPPANGTVRATR